MIVLLSMADAGRAKALGSAIHRQYSPKNPNTSNLIDGAPEELRHQRGTASEVAVARFVGYPFPFDGQLRHSGDGGRDLPGGEQVKSTRTSPPTLFVEVTRHARNATVFVLTRVGDDLRVVALIGWIRAVDFFRRCDPPRCYKGPESWRLDGAELTGFRPEDKGTRPWDRTD